MGETRITHADGAGAFLDAETVVVAILCAPVFNTKGSLLAETVTISVVTFHTFRAIIASEEVMADTGVLIVVNFFTLGSTDTVTFAG